MAKKELNSDDVAIVGGDKEFSITRGDAIDAFTPGDIDTSPVIRTDAIEMEKFLHEMVTVHITEPATENEPKYAEVTVNGDRRVMVRGGEYRIPRKHVAVLAQAKSHRVTQQKVSNQDGSQSFVEKLVPYLSYPFSVIEDPNPNGRAWLKQLLANPV